MKSLRGGLRRRRRWLKHVMPSSLSFAVCMFITAADLTFCFAAAPGCVEPAFNVDAPAVVKSCTAALDRAALSDQVRAILLENRGRALKDAGDIDGAIRDFDAAIKLTPHNDDLRIMRGWAAYDQGKYEDADTLANEALSINSNNAHAYDLRGAIAAISGRLGVAKAAYDTAIKLKPNDVLARYHRFQLYKGVHDYASARKELEDLAQVLTPDLDTMFDEIQHKRMSYRTMIRLEHAALLETMGLTEETEKAFSDWIRVEPGAVSYGWRALFHYDRSRFDLAQADLDKAFSYDRNFWLLHNLQGTIYLYTDRYEDALNSFSHALVDLPTSGPSYWNRALALRAIKRTDEATEEALKAVDVDKDFLIRKTGSLTALGYLQINQVDSDPMPAIRDAVKACMLDKDCW
jgi:tetratricopeptide (TPR) repeat protein